MKLNAYLIKATIVGALGGLLFGFDTAVIAGTTHSLTIAYNLTAGALGLTVSIALWGTVIGSMTSGIIGQRLGGREALRIMALLYIISALGCAFAWNWPSLVVFRFIGGLGIGGSSVLGPVHIAELPPAKWRGRLVGLFQINVVIGILLAYLSNAIIAHFQFGAIEWRLQIGVGIIPAVLFLALLFTVPHSSRWLVTQNRLDEAYRILADLGSPDSRAEVDAIAESIRAEGGLTQHTLFQRRYGKLIFLAISIGFFNH